MKKALLVMTAIFSLLLLVSFAYADVITINGSDSDWTSPDTVNDDPDEGIAQDYDIDLNYFEWDDVNENLCFAYYTYDTLAAYTADNFTRILINADADGGTGGTTCQVDGIEYYLQWDLARTTPAPELWYWNGSDWLENTSPVYVDVDYGGKFVEWAVAAADVGYPSKFEWGAYLDNGGTGDDDFCPDDCDQRGFTPEPATMTLFGLGLLGLGAWRRRRTAA